MRVYKFLDAKFGMKSLAEKRLKISTVEDLNDPFELLPFGMADKTTRMALNNARTTWAATHGMLCFSSDWRDPVICPAADTRNARFSLLDCIGIRYYGPRLRRRPVDKNTDIPWVDGHCAHRRLA